MKSYIQIILILIVFFKTETLLSNNNLFSVNNINIEKNDKISNNSLANQAIKKGFNDLIEKILLKEDIKKLSNLNFSSIKELVTYYQVSQITDEKENNELASFSVTFDKDKIHELFYKKGILYSEILDKEIYILPILIKGNEIYVFNNNFFYKYWNEIFVVDLVEFVLPIENIEIIQEINKNKNSLIDIEIDSLFKEYPNKNLALVLIEDNKSKNNKLYFKTKIQEKKISKSLNIKKIDGDLRNLYEQIIEISKNEIVNLVKSENLIDIRTPSFINTRLNLDRKTNLVEFNSRVKNIDLVENIYVQEFNKDYVNLRIKYLGKLEKIINQFKKANINLKLINEQWYLKVL